MPKPSRTSVKPIGDAIRELVQELGINRKLKEYEAVLRWNSIAGEQIARMTTAVKITQGVLLVKVKTSTWRNELNIRKKEIMNKLNGELGEEIVKDIRFQ